MLKYAITTDVTTEPITVAEAKSHLRVTVEDDDSYISGLISAAREYAEGYHGVAYGTKVVTAVADMILSSYDLPVKPATEITSVVLKTTDGEQTDVTDKYTLDPYTSTLILNSEINLGDKTLIDVNPVMITYKAGMTPRKRTIQAMLIMIGEWYENREASVIGVGVYQLPLSAKQLLEMDRHSDL